YSLPIRQRTRGRVANTAGSLYALGLSTNLRSIERRFLGGPMASTSGSDSNAADDGTTPKEVSPGVLRRAVSASALGNATEWFDYGVYAYVATEIGENFFPGEYSTLGALLVFAVSFVLRPLGGVVWGPLGDKLGRSTILATT